MISPVRPLYADIVVHVAGRHLPPAGERAEWRDRGAHRAGAAVDQDEHPEVTGRRGDCHPHAAGVVAEWVHVPDERPGRRGQQPNHPGVPAAAAIAMTWAGCPRRP